MDKDFANIEGIFKTNTNIVKNAIAEVSPEHWFLRPGDDSNHLMWVTGHLIWSRGNVLKSLKAEWSLPWPSLFERGVNLMSQYKYPEVEELRNAWGDVSTKLLASLADAPAGL